MLTYFFKCETSGIYLHCLDRKWTERKKMTAVSKNQQILIYDIEHHIFSRYFFMVKLPVVGNIEFWISF